MKTKIKHILIVIGILLITALVNRCHAQNMKQISEPRTSFIVNGDLHPKDYVSVGYESGNIKIEGDTTKAIKHLVAFIKQLQDESQERYECIDASVNWQNTVPDYFKNSASYKKYILKLKKQGYKINPKKK